MDELERRPYWIQVLADQMVSGLNKKQFCINNGIKVATFYYWQHKLNEEVANGDKSVAGFQQVILQNPLHENRLEVRLPGGTCLQITGENISYTAALLHEIDRLNA